MLIRERASLEGREVGSLIRKAEQYLDSLSPVEARSRLTLVRRKDPVVQRGEDIKPEEREKILAQIEEAVTAQRMAVSSETLRLSPRRRGVLLPLVVNLIAAFVIAAGIFLALLYFRRSEEAIVAAPVALETAEGKLLAAVKEESRQQLETKDREIASIRQKLVGVDQEKDRIRRDAEQRVRAREQELEAELERTLREERAKLEGEGLSEQVVADRLAALQEKSAAELAERLAEFRQQAEADRAAQDRNVEMLRAEYEQSLGQAQGDRARLLEESTRRQAELEAGYQQKQLALEQDKARAMQELDFLRGQQQREQLVLDQFLSFYRKARDEIRASRLQSAREVLSEFRRYLDDPSVAPLAGISRRRPVELFLIGSLEEAIDRSLAEAADAGSAQSLVASASLVVAVASLVEQGDELFGEQDYEGAREVYLSAMARIPAVQLGSSRLGEIEHMLAAREAEQVRALFASASASYRAGDYARAVAGYGQALELLQGERGVVDTLIAQLQEVGSRTREAELAPSLASLRGQLDTRLAELRSASADLASRDAEISSLRDQVAGRDGDLQRLRGELGSREAELAALRGALEEREATLEELRGAQAAGERRLGELQGEIAARSTATDADRRALEARAAELQSLRVDLALRSGAEEAARRDLAAREALLEALRADLESRDQDIATLRGDLAAREGQIAALGAEVGRLQSDVDAGESELETLRSREATRTGRLEAVSSLRERAGAAAVPAGENPASRAALLDLLQTKLLVQGILLSDEVLGEYPDLYDGLARYLEALVAEKETAARLETLRDLDALLARLARGGEAAEASIGDVVVARYSPADQNALLLDILSKLGELLE